MNSSFLGLAAAPLFKRNYTQGPPPDKPFRIHASFSLNLFQLFLFFVFNLFFARSFVLEVNVGASVGAPSIDRAICCVPCKIGFLNIVVTVKFG